MTDWDDDSERSRTNLSRALADVLSQARQRLTPTVDRARLRQSYIMNGTASPGPQFVGRFRGETGLEGCEVQIGPHLGVSSDNVAEELKRFEEKLQKTVEALDGLITPDQDMSADDLAEVIDLCAWVHSEWIRIHPFANGNGRTARLWANCIAMRYGVPPFVRLRPRPDGGYGDVCGHAMAGQWQPTVRVFRRMYSEAIRR